VATSSQPAASQANVPVQVTSLFGQDPTSGAVTFAVTAPGAACPTTFPNTASWSTDAQGRHWALCPTGPSGPYTPTAGSTVWYWVKFTAGTETPIVGPVQWTFI